MVSRSSLNFSVRQPEDGPRQAAGSGVAADACVDDGRIDVLARQALLEQRDPAAAADQAVSGREAVADDEDRPLPEGGA